MAFTLIMPAFMLVLHIVSELVRPISLSLRLRSNVYGDDVILALFASWGIKDGFLWLFPNFILVMLTSAIQAAVFSLLTLVYFFPGHETRRSASLIFCKKLKRRGSMDFHAGLALGLPIGLD